MINLILFVYLNKKNRLIFKALKHDNGLRVGECDGYEQKLIYKGSFNDNQLKFYRENNVHRRLYE